ncbi:MAG: NAD(+)/NADH kinase [Fusobacterium sp.]|uniref:NAD(+)/NADH kinase n=1 Tax=Fusobacterium sp. TaxID=68766 RepID=UPI0026DD6BD1|nr:NAD(+)/NADH kinase [Fusobacterium sp.]MDO4691123.1 NAD(+)/NADH kinase [Fusobacterium sp.]
MKNICIIHNDQKESAIKILEDVKKYLENKGIKTIPLKQLLKADYVIVIGGDGTLLRAFQKLKNKEAKIVAINAGTLGFITEVRKDLYKEILDNILNDDICIEERYFLEVKIGKKTYEALNEVYLTKDNIKRNIVSSEIFVEDKFLGEFKGDGVILSTPTGSTAYSLSAGGPVVTPELKLFLITPIAPHNLNTRPLILSGDLNIKLNLSLPSEQAYITIDGNIHHKINSKDIIEIKYSKEKLKLVIPKKRNYYEVLREKLKWGENLC